MPFARLMAPVAAFRLAAATLGAIGVLASCVTPNLLGETPPVRVASGDFAPGAEAVEVEVGERDHLRGVFVKASPGAPVVLHLLGGGETLTSSTTVAGREVWIGDVVRELAALGLSSLVLDYRGVGRSDGARDSRHLPADARAAWAEAVRRAGGDSRRVVLRALSVGTLAAASLIDQGARPGAVTLLAPLRAETVAVHWLQARRSSLLALLGQPFLRPALAVDQEATIARIPSPLLLVVALRDELLPADERRRLTTAGRRAGATVIEHDQDHLALTRDAHRLMPEERAFYRSVTGI